MKLILSIVTIFFTHYVLATSLKHGFTQQENLWMAEQNAQLAELTTTHLSLFANASDPLSLDLLKSTQVRPFAEFEKAGYLIFNAEFEFSSKKAKLAMAQNLPKDMKLVIFTGSLSSDKGDRIRKQFADVIEEERLKVVYIPHGNRGFWARDGVPVPVIRRGLQETEQLTLVDARYYHQFESDTDFGVLFNASLTRHNYYYEGGNFMANSQGDCLVINNQTTQEMPDAIFENHYGCQKLTRLPHVKGIGHADESVKFIDDQTVLTDEKSYVSILQKQGYKVIELPRPDLKYETYVNSLIVNGLVYVPIFNEKNDEKALEVYRQLGLQAVGLDSRVLSNQGLGSLHCITMTYPEVTLNELLKSLGGYLL